MVIKIPDRSLPFAKVKNSFNVMKFPLFLYRGFRTMLLYSISGADMTAATCRKRDKYLISVFEKRKSTNIYIYSFFGMCRKGLLLDCIYDGVQTNGKKFI